MRGIRNGKIILKDAVVEGRVLLYDRRIAGLEERVDSAAVTEWIDAAGCLVAPGFIDIHCHGAGGFDTMDDRPGAITAVSEQLLAGGTTAFLPTTVTMPMPAVHRALRAIGEAAAAPPRGARVLGAHLEGPFINPARKGAHDEAHILPPAVDPIRGHLILSSVTTGHPPAVVAHFPGNLSELEK